MTQSTTNISLIDTEIVLRQSSTTTRVAGGYEGIQTFLVFSCLSSILSFDIFVFHISISSLNSRPVNVPLDIFSEEIQFYELGESAITKFRCFLLSLHSRDILK